MIEFAFWADGEFCELSQIDEFTWKSDDYEVVRFNTEKEAEVHGSKIVAKPHQKLLGLSDEELLRICPEATHQHYKGGLYRLDKHDGSYFVHCKKDDELLSIYCHVFPYEKKLWARPQKEFFGRVNVDGAKVRRFRSLDQGVPF